ncbi:MAG: DUF2283 domain-containing protein [Candidatus Aenigmarchaeota archaeon]|nr:DUF2283 domain-containing protein [Candidatus Aenigmarchaeota archaeon]
MQKFEFSYDIENDDLFVYHKGKKTKGSIELGSVIIDIDNEGKINAIQIINASKYISKIIKNISKDMLKKIKACKIEFKHDQNVIIIRLFLIFENKTPKLLIPISLPSITRASPASR